MPTRLLFTLLIGAACSGALADEPVAATRWYKGNTHTHSLWSDGNEFPDMIAKWYVDNDYDFLVLSDHNVLSRGEKWMKLSTITKRRNPDALKHYRAAFPDNWVETRGEGANRAVRLKTLEEVREKLEKPGEFIMIEGEEITGAWGRAPVHINAVNIDELIKPQPGNSVREVMRKAMQKVREQSERTGKPMFAHLNHPNFHYGVTAEDIAHVVEEPFFEVFNGHPGVNNHGNEQHASTERMWDIICTIRLSELKAPPVYGVATDDSHHYHESETHRPGKSIPGRGWVMVRAASLDADSITRAMIAGDFYASTGVTFKRLEFDPDKRTLGVAIDAVDGINYTIRFVGTMAEHDGASEPVVDGKGKELRATRRYSDEIGATLKTVKGAEATYQLTGKELYVRAVITSDQPVRFPMRELKTAGAWTQPVGWRKWIKP